MTRIIAWTALGLSVVACAVVPVEMHRRTQAAIDRALRQREAQLVERYTPLIHAMGRRYMNAAELENVEAVDQMFIAAGRIMRAMDAKLKAAEDLVRQAAAAPTAVEPPVTGDAAEFLGSDSETKSVSLRTAHGRVEATDGAALLHEAVDEMRREAAADRALKGQIAFIAATGAQVDVHLMNADGSDLRQLTDDHDQERCVSLSSDGRQAVFSVRRGDAHDIRLLDLASASLMNLSAEIDQTFGSYVAWMPGEKTILVSVAENGGWAFKRLEVATGKLTDLPGELSNESSPPVWSPDGSRVAYTQGGYLFIADSNFDHAALVGSDGGSSQLGPLGIPVWLPREEGLVFASADSGRPKAGSEGDPFRFSLFQCDASGGAVRRLTQTKAVELPLGVSPDGRTLLLMAVTDQGKPDLILLDIDGAHRRPLFDESRNVIWASWSVKPTNRASR